MLLKKFGNIFCVSDTNLICVNLVRRGNGDSGNKIEFASATNVSCARKQGNTAPVGGAWERVACDQSQEQRLFYVMADDNKDVEQWSSLSSVSLHRYVDKKISICLSDNSRKVGWVYAIDPVTHTVVLQEETEDLNAKKLTFVMGHAISRVVLEEDEGPRPVKIDFLESEKTKEYSQDELLKRKGDLIDWLTKNRIPVTESSEDSAMLSVMGVLLVEPPYDGDSCRCSNEIVLDRIQKLIRTREDHK